MARARLARESQDGRIVAGAAGVELCAGARGQLTEGAFGISFRRVFAGIAGILFAYLTLREKRR
jgi:hypothetical protein